MRSTEQYQQTILQAITAYSFKKQPQGLYRPLAYILQLGGKRLRPVLTLMTADAFSGSYTDAIPAALAVEFFHNFSLIHDDIMDDAPVRRGQPTVHEKWDVNTGILSGDAMLVKAYQFFETYPAELQVKLIKLFSETALHVCEGQQYDMDFEQQQQVSLSDYLNMIKGKTAVLLGCALKMGAYIADASEEDAQHMYDFGVHLGLAFQIQDDYLDAFGNPETFGKQVGGDILENKKTFLYLKALERADAQTKATLLDWYAITKKSDDKVQQVKNIFTETGAAAETKETVAFYTQKAFNYLNKTSLSATNKEHFISFATSLIDRQS